MVRLESWPRHRRYCQVFHGFLSIFVLALEYDLETPRNIRTPLLSNSPNERVIRR